MGDIMYADLPQRKTIRLKDYDYSQAGFYFVTICTENRRMLFGSDEGATIGRLPLTEAVKIIETALRNIETIYSNVFIDEYVIMPNHIHFILVIGNRIDNGRSMAAPMICRIIQQFKGYVTKNCRQKGFGWQKSYYEHIIRNEEDLQKIRDYIHDNPAKWQDDEYFTLAGDQWSPLQNFGLLLCTIYIMLNICIPYIHN